MTALTIKEQFAVPFAEEELRTFVGKGGQEFTYVEDETVMDRLDQVLGVGNWQIVTEAVPIYEGVVKVRLGVQLHGEWRWYEDFGYPNNGTSGQALKEAVSDGIRRCGRYLGIARDLYRKDPAPSPTARQRLRDGNGRQAIGASHPAIQASLSRAADDVLGGGIDDVDFSQLSPVKPGAVALAPSRGEGVMWSKELFERAEAEGIDKKKISDTAKRMFGDKKWRVLDLSDGERFALAVELGIA